VNAASVASITNGRLQGSPYAEILRGRADSRLCRPGDLYVALPGENTDGSLFAARAWAAGAEVVLADKSKDLPLPDDGKALITVADPLAALHELSRNRRLEMQNLKVIGITGSNGKTTTKEILAAILRDWKKEAVLVTEGNYNSDIGLPLTMLSLRPGHEIAVLEMGMNKVGEMALLAELARPDIAVITNVGSAHVGMLGSREALAAEKRAIFNYAGPESVAIVGCNEVWKDFLLDGFPGKVRYFGEWGSGGWESHTDVGIDGHIVLRYGKEIRFKLPGVHNLQNAMAAVEAALELGVSEESIVNGLNSVAPIFGRSEIINGAVTVIRDCYNANPESLNAALELFSSMAVGGRKILVLGELLELGNEMEEALRQAGGAAAAVQPDSIFLFGSSLEVLKNAALVAGYQGEIRLFTEIELLESALSLYMEPGDLVLLKGSRGSALERLDKVIGEVSSG
jgi:UDP-N-acetylmuramoyl-tripeptide--D-alanyl-D-alanine ligase